MEVLPCDAGRPLHPPAPETTNYNRPLLLLLTWMVCSSWGSSHAKGMGLLGLGSTSSHSSHAEGQAPDEEGPPLPSTCVVQGPGGCGGGGERSAGGSGPMLLLLGAGDD